MSIGVAGNGSPRRFIGFIQPHAPPFLVKGDLQKLP